MKFAQKRQKQIKKLLKNKTDNKKLSVIRAGADGHIFGRAGRADLVEVRHDRQNLFAAFSGTANSRRLKKMLPGSWPIYPALLLSIATPMLRAVFFRWCPVGYFLSFSSSFYFHFMF